MLSAATAIRIRTPGNGERDPPAPGVLLGSVGQRNQDRPVSEANQLGDVNASLYTPRLSPGGAAHS
jgi:hypothetical protein